MTKFVLVAVLLLLPLQKSFRKGIDGSTVCVGLKVNDEHCSIVRNVPDTHWLLVISHLIMWMLTECRLQKLIFPHANEIFFFFSVVMAICPCSSLLKYNTVFFVFIARVIFPRNKQFCVLEWIYSTVLLNSN
jgi:hypothetical protein